MVSEIKTLVYIGQRPSIDEKKLLSVFHEIPEMKNSDYLEFADGKVPDLDLTNEILFSDLKGLYHTVGGIYEIPATRKEDGNYSWAFHDAKRIDHWPDESQIAAWKTTDTANKITIGKEKSLLKKDKMDYLLEHLLPLRKEYLNLRGNSRIVFELRVLSALRRKP